MEPQELAFLGRVSQFLKQRSCLGANISLYCPASEGSQESRQEGGRCSRIFLPSTPKRTGASKQTGGGWEVIPSPGGCRGTGRRQKGESGGDMHWSLVQVQPRTRLCLPQGMLGNAHHTLAGLVLQPVSFMTPDLPSQLSLLLLRGICWMTSFLGQWLRRWGVLDVERGMSC